MPKRVALCLFGISVYKYNPDHLHWDGNEYAIHYKHSVSNYKTYIYDYFKQHGYDMDVYLCSNVLNAQDKQELLDTYHPVRYSFKPNEKDNTTSRNSKVDGVIDLCLSSNIPYDVVLITRFDLLFQKNFNESFIDLNKFNMVSVLEQSNLICDNFYLFPFHVLPLFSTIVKNNMHRSHHHLQHEINSMRGSHFVNYICNEHVVVKELTFYKICRTKNSQDSQDKLWIGLGILGVGCIVYYVRKK